MTKKRKAKTSSTLNNFYFNPREVGSLGGKRVFSKRLAQNGYKYKPKTISK